METTDNGVSTSVGITPAKQTTADDLLDMYDSEPAQAAAEVQAEVDKQAKVQEVLPKALKAQEIVKSLEKKEDSESTDGGAEEGAVQPEAPEDGGEEPKPAEPSVPSIKARFGDKDIDIPEEAQITGMLNGQEVTFKVRNAIEAFVERDNWSKTLKSKEDKIDHKYKAHSEELASINQRGLEVVKLAMRGDPIAGIGALAKLAAGNSKVPVADIERQVLENFNKIYDAYNKWTPEQRDAFYAKRAATLEREDAERVRGEAEAIKSEHSLRTEVGEMKARTGMTDESIRTVLDIMAEQLVGEDRQFKSINQITVKDVESFHVSAQHLSKVKQAAAAVNPELAKDNDFTIEVWERTRGDPDFQDQKELEDVIRQAVGVNSKAVENLNRRMEKSGTKELHSKIRQITSEAGNKNDELDPDFFRAAIKRQEQIARMRFR